MTSTHSPYLFPLFPEENARNFDLENKVRTIVAEMLLNMNDKLTLCGKDLKNMQHDLATFQMKIHETNTKLDREAKIKDLVD